MKMKKRNKTARCKLCNKKFTPKKNDVRTKYCSTQCKDKAWRLNNSTRWSDIQRKARHKKILPCRHCGDAIPNDQRKHGVSFCSDTCRKLKKQADNRKRNKKIHDLFAQFKLAKGCSICGYNKCGACLEYHHADPSKKERRITAKMWYANTVTIQKEIAKCILVCKNCHGEIHDRWRNNI